MGIVRVQKNSNYSVISNVHLQDESLSWKAKGLLSYLLSKPDNWQVYVAHLKNQSTDGRDATASGIRELIEVGYITRDYSRNEAGQITGRDYVVHEAALEDKAVERPANNDENPKTENPLTVEPTTVDTELSNTDYIKNRLTKNTDNVPPPNPAPETSPKMNHVPPPSFSEFELISILAGLINIIPKQHQKPTVSETINKALTIHTEDYIRLAILYTITHSNGNTTQKFKAYLGKCIDSGWAVGWEPENDKGSLANAKAIREEFKQMPDKALKTLADTGNIWAISEMKRRKK